ncbi:hypothetical protein TrST_g1754 [Triparma strigata]|uniref:Potassium channel domain-containing protein n=1 Tax=Triparma strigata TaxID=1606541 RepID=A0A9W7C6I3_9STRA|nr:hypothetical protein TrST_g1754 [Triparma strigata]
MFEGDKNALSPSSYTQTNDVTNDMNEAARNTTDDVLKDLPVRSTSPPRTIKYSPRSNLAKASIPQRRQVPSPLLSPVSATSLQSSTSIETRISLHQNHYALAANSATLQKSSRNLSIHQGCLLSLFLFLSYVLLSILFYSFWSSDKLSVVDSILLSFYTITTVGYGNQQPSSTLSLYYTVWVMLSGIALLTLMVASMVQSLKIWREEKDDGVHKIEERIQRRMSRVEITSPKVRDKVRKWKAKVWGFFKNHSVGEVLGQIIVLCFLIAVGAICIGIAESWTFIESVYFAVSTVTTIGYGDISPLTTAGKILTIIYLPTSLIFMSSYLRLVATFYMRCHKANIGRIMKNSRREMEKQAAVPPSPDDTENSSQLTPNPIRPTTYFGATSASTKSRLSVDTSRPKSPVEPTLAVSPKATPTSRWSALAVMSRRSMTRRPISPGKPTLATSPKATPTSRWSTLAVSTPAKTRTRVQKRLGTIIATEVAHLRGRIEIEGDRISVNLPGAKRVVEKWMIPRSAIRAFQAVSYEALLEVGEIDFLKKGVAAFEKIDYEDRVLLFAPLIAMMGNFEAMNAWLKGTDFIEKNDKEQNKNLRSISMAAPGALLSTSERSPSTESTKIVRSASMADIENGNVSPKKERGWSHTDFSLAGNLKSEKFRIT